MFKVQLHAHFKAPVQTRINVAEIFILIMHKTFFLKRTSRYVIQLRDKTKEFWFQSTQQYFISYFFITLITII